MLLNSEDYRDVFIVLPTLNEREAIGSVIDELFSIGVPKDRIMVVDGGSTDGTLEIARSKGVITIIQEGKGKADALSSALKHIGNVKYVLVMDADYTYPAKYVKPLIDKIREGYDEVIGYRKIGDIQSLMFKFGNKVLTFAFNMLFGTSLHDVLSGMYIVRLDATRDMIFEMSGFSVESEIAAHIASTSGKITEIPISYRKRLGKKKLKVLHGFKIAKDMMRLAWRYNPTFFIFFSGSLFLIPGIILGIWVGYNYFFTGVKYYVKGLVAVIATLFGFISLSIALLSLYLKRMEMRLRTIIRDLKKSVEEYKEYKEGKKD